MDEKKPFGKKQKIIGLAVGAIVVVALAAFFLSGDLRTYKKAEALLEDKKFDQAQEALKPLVEKEYRDSKLFTQYIEGMRAINTAEKEVNGTSVSGAVVALTTAEQFFNQAGGFKDSKSYVPYCKASQKLLSRGIYADNEKELTENYSKAGDVAGSDDLLAFVKAIASANYEDAAEAAQAYRKEGGFLLTDEKLAEIAANVPQFRYDETDDAKKVEDAIRAANAMFGVSDGIRGQYKKLSNQVKVESPDALGLGSASKGKVLIIDVDMSESVVMTQKVNLPKTAALKENYFPENAASVQYLIRVCTSSKHEKDFTGGGRRVPGYTESMYCELYDVTKGAVVYKSKKVKGPKLQKSYYTSLPAITASWPDKDQMGEKLINEALGGLSQ